MGIACGVAHQAVLPLSNTTLERSLLGGVATQTARSSDASKGRALSGNAVKHFSGLEYREIPVFPLARLADQLPPMQAPPKTPRKNASQRCLSGPSAFCSDPGNFWTTRDGQVRGTISCLAAVFSLLFMSGRRAASAFDRQTIEGLSVLPTTAFEPK